MRKRCVRIVRWQVEKGGRSVRWQSGESDRVARWQGKRFLVLFKYGGFRMDPRFNLFVSDVNQRNKGAGCFPDFIVDCFG